MITKEYDTIKLKAPYKKKTSPRMDQEKIQRHARRMHTDIAGYSADVIQRQVDGISALTPHVTEEDFACIIACVLSMKGRLVCCGVGKSGHIAKKISATLASTGTASLFVHPAEASHGDLGMIAAEDIVLMLSNSGETKELEDIIAYCTRFAIPMIGVVRRAQSMLAKAADFPVVLPDIPEAGDAPAPSTSTTMMLVWGDTLALALAHQRGFTHEDFGDLHPGGKLGSRLKRLSEVMVTGADLPVVSFDTKMSDVLIEMTTKSCGCAMVVDAQGRICGIITDGDLRRHMCENFVSLTADSVMFDSPTVVQGHILAAEGLRLMNTKKFTVLPVCDSDNKPTGLVHMQMLLSAGVY